MSFLFNTKSCSVVWMHHTLFIHCHPLERRSSMKPYGGMLPAPILIKSRASVAKQVLGKSVNTSLWSERQNLKLEKKPPLPDCTQWNELEMTQPSEVFLPLPQALSASSFTVEEADGDQGWRSAHWGLGKSCSYRQPVRLSWVCSHVPAYLLPPHGIKGAQIAPWFLRTMGSEHVTWTLDSALSGIPHLVATFPDHSYLRKEKSICPFVKTTRAL